KSGPVRIRMRRGSWPSRRIFFFQAEDGIRAFHVTGVQTCALPIWRHLHLDRLAVRVARQLGADGIGDRLLRVEVEASGEAAIHRSEERRVGKRVDLGGRRSSERNKDAQSSWAEAKEAVGRQRVGRE